MFRAGGPGTADVSAQRQGGFAGRRAQVAGGGTRTTPGGATAAPSLGVPGMLQPTRPYVPPPSGMPIPQPLGRVAPGGGWAGAAIQRAQTAAAPVPGRARPGDGVGAYVNQFQGYAREGVQAFGDQVGQDFRKDVGSYLGNLNGIGALRSGAAVTGVDDLMTTYGRQIGNAASQATLHAVDQGQQEFDSDVERKARADAAAKQRHASLLKGVGTALGAGIGFFAGGPVGASAGASLGGKAFDKGGN